MERTRWGSFRCWCSPPGTRSWWAWRSSRTAELERWFWRAGHLSWTTRSRCRGGCRRLRCIWGNCRGQWVMYSAQERHRGAVHSCLRTCSSGRRKWGRRTSRSFLWRTRERPLDSDRWDCAVRSICECNWVECSRREGKWNRVIREFSSLWLWKQLQSACTHVSSPLNRSVFTVTFQARKCSTQFEGFIVFRKRARNATLYLTFSLEILREKMSYR